MTTGRRVVSARSLIGESELPVHEASRLLQVATGRDRAGLARHDTLEIEHVERFDELVQRRRSGEPLQYLEGSSQFGPVQLKIDRRVLIPRPETEELWELVVTRLIHEPPALVVDLGTGSGNLALALKYAFPEAEVHAVELSAAAADLAAENISNSGLDVTLHRGDLFDGLPPSLAGAVDLIVSNPPYIATPQREALPTEVRDHEPEIALFAGEDGLDVLRRVIEGAASWLAPGGTLACEIGSDQGRQALELAGWADATIARDLAGHERFLIAEKGAE